MAGSTQGESRVDVPERQGPVPGAVLVFSGNAPQLRAFPISTGPLVIDRDQLKVPDAKMSRPHATISFDGPGWTVKDLGSKNGTAVQGKKLEPNGEWRAASGNVVRAGASLFLLFNDVRRFLVGEGVTAEGSVIVGPTLRAELDKVAIAARSDRTVLVGGENGSGKEIAARTFHEAAGRRGPFVAKNCAELVETLAEAQLFGIVQDILGNRKGGERQGLVQAADGGTLFLDEVGELHPEVQAKLLRVLEKRVVMPVGANEETPVDVRVVAATNRDLRRAVAAGEFRQDLFYRLAQVEVRVPPLRERREEIPWLIDARLRDEKVRVAHVSLVEAAVMRPWPGNVRELRDHVKLAAVKADVAKSETVRAEHLEEQAGEGVVAAAPRPPEPAPAASSYSKQPSCEAAKAMLVETDWNVAEAARRLNLHRNQLNRIIKRCGLERPDGQSAAEDDEG